MSSQGSFLLRGALRTGAMQLVSIGLTFGTAIALARVLGEGGFGAYSYALTWGVVLLGPATFGIGPILTRETAAGIETGRFGRVRAIRAFSVRLAAISSLVVVLGGVSLVFALSRWIEAENVGPLAVGMPVTAASAAVLVARQILLGLRRVAAAQVAESVLRPALFLLAVGAVVLAGLPLDASGAMALYGVATVACLLWLVPQIRSATPAPVSDAAPEPDDGWLRAALPLLLAGIARDLNSQGGVLVMGMMLSPEDVGLFRAAQRLSTLPMFVLSAVNLTFLPVASALFAKGDLAQIEILGIRASRVVVLVSLPILAGFFVGGDLLLGLFGDGFVRAEPALWILGLGQLFNVACGSVGVILTACNREDDVARGLVFSCFVTMIANVLFIQLFGLLGAAIATSFGLVVWNSVLSWFTWQRLGILPAAFSWRRLRW